MADLSFPAFADALRQMAENADRVADRHDIAKMDRLQNLVLTQRSQAQRDADLIAELRRQAEAMGRSLDGIGKLRKIAMVDDCVRDVVQILTDALLIIGEQGCSNYVGSSCQRSGRGRRAEFTAERWCDECIARDALERAGWTDGHTQEDTHG